MNNRNELIKILLSTLYQAKEQNTDLKEVKILIDNLIIKYGIDMVEIIKDLNEKEYTHITYANGIGKYFFTRANEDYITLKGIEHYKNQC